MDGGDLDRLARLHARSLPDSLIGALGAAYVRAFYRYVERSAHELFAVRRDATGQIVAAAVLSVEPSSLNTRLLKSTPLLRSMALRLPRMLAWLRSSMRGRGATGREMPAALPQLIVIFTAADERGRGHASALIEELEDRLRQRRVVRYEVRTEADPANPALAFYRRRGFEPSGLSVRFGTPFQVFTRELAPLNRHTP
jgi:ribosomal protein S18 acetylase RimI-like enzyme